METTVGQCRRDRGCMEMFRTSEEGEVGLEIFKLIFFLVKFSRLNSLSALGSRSQVPGPGALMPLHSGEDGDQGRGRGLVPPGGSLNEQIVVALARLQEDMQSVLERLHTLEALSASQVRR